MVYDRRSQEQQQHAAKQRLNATAFEVHGLSVVFVAANNSILIAKLAVVEAASAIRSLEVIGADRSAFNAVGFTTSAKANNEIVPVNCKVKQHRAFIREVAKVHWRYLLK